MKLSENLKKILISCATLLMFASVGAGISQITEPVQASQISRLMARRRRDYNDIRTIDNQLNKLRHHHSSKSMRRRSRQNHRRKATKYADFDPLKASNFNKLCQFTKIHSDVSNRNKGLYKYSPNFVKGYKQYMYDNSDRVEYRNYKRVGGLTPQFTWHMRHNPGYETGEVMLDAVQPNQSGPGDILNKSYLKDNIQIYKEYYLGSRKKAAEEGAYIVD